MLFKAFPQSYTYNLQEKCQQIIIEMAIFRNSIPIIFLTFNSSSHVQCFFNCFTPFYNIDWWKSLLQWITVHFFYSISTYFLGSGSVDVVSTDFVLKKHLWSLKTKIVIVDFMKHIPTMEFKPSVVLPWYAILQILGGKSPTLTGIVAKYL